MAPAKTLLTVIAAAVALVGLMMGSEGGFVLVIALGALAALQYAGKDRPITANDPSTTRPWYLWLAAAAVLFAIGVGALVVLGDGETVTGQDDTSLLGALAWIIWMLSWAAAAITFVLGTGLGAKRLIAIRR